MENPETMSDLRSHEALIDRLGTDLVPVRRLLPPWLRTVGCMGAVITAITAAWAAFALGVPGRPAAWAWLPLPGAVLWIGASGLGCLRLHLRNVLAAGTQVPTMHQSADCLIFIISFSIPLSALLIVLVRRACPLRPVLTAVLIGLASAAASASLLEICHAFDAAATDLLTHVLAVAVVVAVNATMGGRLLSKA
jgi:hypothetical protein